METDGKDLLQSRKEGYPHSGIGSGKHPRRGRQDAGNRWRIILMDNLLVMLIGKKGRTTMAEIYVALILKGRKTYAQVPKVLK